MRLAFCLEASGFRRRGAADFDTSIVVRCICYMQTTKKKREKKNEDLVGKNAPEERRMDGIYVQIVLLSTAERQRDVHGERRKRLRHRSRRETPDPREYETNRRILWS